MYSRTIFTVSYEGCAQSAHQFEREATEIKKTRADDEAPAMCIRTVGRARGQRRMSAWPDEQAQLDGTCAMRICIG